MHKISNKTLIREMDSSELENYLYNIWLKLDKKTSLLILNSPEVGYIAQCYKQLTGDNILYNINSEFTNDILEMKKKK